MLDGLKWNSAIAELLRRVLIKWSELGFPVRRTIVAYKLPKSQTPEARQDSHDVRKILGLEGVVDDVILMEISPQEHPSEVDWMVWYPEKYDLPANVGRDWPAWWPSESGSS